MAVALSELEKRPPTGSLISTLGEGERIVLKSVLKKGRKVHPIFIHDPIGEIKVGNENVVIWEAPK